MGPVQVVDRATVEFLKQHRLIQSNMKFPHESAWTQRRLAALRFLFGADKRKPAGVPAVSQTTVHVV
ncbi:MAG: hypothetical protein AUK03_02300 [Anaerolineae bacterium CG2_30_64_16]|nr:MAG: hypothetical protein AUK03_02300 [Anaerolineae bacterium CG2_30_64_16]